MPTIEEDFSDPEDLPLDAAPSPPSPAASRQQQQPTTRIAAGAPGGPQRGYKEVAEEVYKGWETIYPIYIDAKRPQQDGARRVNKATAVEWPIAEFMAQACNMLGVEAVFEPHKSHPKDWDNPGRVKVLLKVDGIPKNPSIKNKRILLTRICALLKPHQPLPLTPNSLPPIEKRLPAHSPAVSHGILAQSMKGGGMGGMLGNLLGGGGAAEQEGEAPVEEVKKKEGPKVIKPKKIHQKKRR